jgi:hypothetical protein
MLPEILLLLRKGEALPEEGVAVVVQVEAAEDRWRFRPLSSFPASWEIACV